VSTTASLCCREEPTKAGERERAVYYGRRWTEGDVCQARKEGGFYMLGGGESSAGQGGDAFLRYAIMFTCWSAGRKGSHSKTDISRSKD